METTLEVREFARLCVSKIDPETYEKGLYVRIRVGPTKRSAEVEASDIKVEEGEEGKLAHEIERRLPTLLKHEPGWVELIARGGKKALETLPMEVLDGALTVPEVEGESSSIRALVAGNLKLSFAFARLADTLLRENRALMAEAIDLHRDQAMMETDMVHQLEDNESKHAIEVLKELEPIIEGAGEWLKNGGRKTAEAG